MKNEPILPRQTPEQLFHSHIKLARLIVEATARNAPEWFDRDDLHAIGLAAMWEVAQRYDYRPGVSFASACSARIRGAVLDELRRHDWMPRNARTAYKRVVRKRQELEQQRQCAVGLWEACREAGLSEEEACALEQDMAISFVSLQMTVDPEQSNGADAPELGDAIADENVELPFDTVARQEDRELLERCVEKLDLQMRAIVRLYFWNGIPLRDIATCLGLTESRACQIVDVAVLRLRKLVQQLRDTS